MTGRGRGHRCTQRIDETTLDELLATRALKPVVSHPDYAIRVGFAIERELNKFPSREEFYVTAPITVASRARYGIPWFETKWAEAAQTTLF